MKSASASPATCAVARDTRTSSKPFSMPPPRSTACRSRRPQNERPDLHLRAARRSPARHGLQEKACRGHSFRSRQGNYVDDLRLPGMLYGDFTRSPHGHARIKKIDTTKAAAVPGVVAVLTAETLKTVNLAWMPTLAGDVQMVLADGKVLFQNQEVAFVIAEERYIAADAADLVEV